MTTSPSIENATEKMKSGASEFKDAVVTQGSDMLNRTCDRTEAMIRDHPYTSVAIAFGVGALAAFGLSFAFKK
jgi:ElaB/YqjD/DUF883 family membrane-anchored ribosome-binding protein